MLLTPGPVSAFSKSNIEHFSPAEGARETASRAFANAARLDVDGAFPAEEVLIVAIAA
jgi:hypothetical protein